MDENRQCVSWLEYGCQRSRERWKTCGWSLFILSWLSVLFSVLLSYRVKLAELCCFTPATCSVRSMKSSHCIRAAKPSILLYRSFSPCSSSVHSVVTLVYKYFRVFIQGTICFTTLDDWLHFSRIFPHFFFRFDWLIRFSFIDVVTLIIDGNATAVESERQSSE